MVQFLSKFFSWISSIFVGFFKSSRFFLCHPVLHPVILLHDVNEQQKQQRIELCPFGDKQPSPSNAAEISFTHSPLSSLLILSSSCAVLNDFLSFTLP